MAETLTDEAIRYLNRIAAEAEAREQQRAKFVADAAALAAKEAELKKRLDEVRKPLDEARASMEIALQETFSTPHWDAAQALVKQTHEVFSVLRKQRHPDAELAEAAYEKAIEERDAWIASAHAAYEEERAKHAPVIEAEEAKAAQELDDLKRSL